MHRAFTNLSDQIVYQIDQDAQNRGITRSKLISIAVEEYIKRDSPNDQSQQIAHLTALLDTQRSEIEYLRDHSNMLAAKIVPALPAPIDTHGRMLQNEPESEPEYTIAKIPLWKRMKFWTWV